MTTVGESADRRRNTLLGNPSSNGRRTLLNDGSTVSSEKSTSWSEVSTGKRRKGLLSTPDQETLVTDEQASYQCVGDDQFRKRRALLPDAALQSCHPEQSLPNNSYGVGTAVTPGVSSEEGSTSMAPTRRVLLSLTALSQDINTPVLSDAVSTATADPLHCSTTSRNSRPALLSHLDADETAATTTRPTVDAKSTDTDASVEENLDWLYSQRALIDRRIAELRQKGDKTDNGDDVVIYVNGYYCRACRRFIDGDYDSKTAHCRDSEHSLNAEEYSKDPEAILKDFEERYEGIAFDDDVTDSEVQAPTSKASNLSSWRRLEPSHQTDSSSSGMKTNCAVASETDEDDDQDGRGRSRERFDRTRISRN